MKSFPCEGSEALGQVAQSSYGCPIPSSVQGRLGRCAKQPALVESVRAHGGSWSGWFGRCLPAHPGPCPCASQRSCGGRQRERNPAARAEPGGAGGTRARGNGSQCRVLPAGGGGGRLLLPAAGAGAAALWRRGRGIAGPGASSPLRCFPWPGTSGRALTSGCRGRGARGTGAAGCRPALPIHCRAGRRARR